MSRLHEPLQQHIHDALVSECNDMSVRIKLYNQLKDRKDEPMEKLRRNHPAPTWDEILSLIDRCRDEMNQCTK